MADAFYLLREEGVGTAREHPLGFIDRTEFWKYPELLN